MTLSGDGLIGAWPARCAGSRARCWASCPAGAATTSPACSASRCDAVAACAGHRRRASAASARPRRRRRPAVHRHRQPGLRLRGQPDRQRGARTAGPAGLRLRRAAGAGRLEARHASPSSVDGDARGRFTGWSVGACNSRAYGGGMYVAPDAELDDGLLDVVLSLEDAASWRSCASLPGSSRASTSSCRASSPARRRGRISAPTGRSSSTPTATRSASCRSPSRAVPPRCEVLCPRAS